eukprot:366425_1
MKSAFKLQRAIEELGGCNDRLQDTKKGYSENVKRFQEINDKLSKLADDNIVGLEKLQKMSKTTQDSIQKELIQHQRDILMRVQESMEFGDDMEGLNETEYNKFIGCLPKSFQKRFKNMGKFRDIAGDGILQMDSFTILCDRFANEEAADFSSHKD